jgi:hypothetical protein
LILFGFEPFKLGLTGGNLGGDTRLLAVGARRAVFVGAGLAVGVVLVEARELRLESAPLLIERVDRGIGDVLFRALAEAEPGMIVVGVTLIRANLRYNILNTNVKKQASARMRGRTPQQRPLGVGRMNEECVGYR